MPRWRNWAGDQVCTPLLYDRPRDEDELADRVGRAARASHPVKAVGAGHSFTDAACTEGQMVCLDRMCSVLDVDRASGLVEVQGGIRLGALGAALAGHGLALENLGDVAYQSLAGALSTATHGTGLRYGNLSQQVEALRIVTAAGEVVTASAAGDPDLFRAARVGIGALGVISSVTLRCVPSYTLRRVDDPLPLDEVLDSLDERVRAHDHFELFTFPYTRTAFTRATDRVDAAPAPPSRAARFLKDVVLENAALGAVNRGARVAPRLTPSLVRMLPRLSTREERTDRSDLVFANARLVRFTEMEYAIPREHGAAAVRAIMDLVESRRLPVAFPLEVRCAPPDDAFLGPSFGRESCYVAVHVHRGTPFESYFRGVEKIMTGYGGRPHWGKR
ncbi:MAG: L-gulono,4-lactone dehydrogenase, partial [Thermoleophilaceae bacterium]|nr:L-gulono,4-lactone dehydrogenase [Thermoleophilaceae bacterium]